MKNNNLTLNGVFKRSSFAKTVRANYIRSKPCGFKAIKLDRMQAKMHAFNRLSTLFIGA